MLKRLTTRIPASIQKTRLDHFLYEWLPEALGVPMTKTRIRQLALAGAVYVNRRRCKNVTTPLFPGTVVEVYYDDEKMNRNQPQRMDDSRLETDRVVYEDDSLIVINKPPGIPTQPTMDPLRANLFDLLKRYLDNREKVEKSYVGLHHRLDRDTSGLVLFTKKTSANKFIADLFKEHRIAKTYQCLVWQSPKALGYQRGDQFIIENYLGKLSQGNSKIARFGAVTSGGDQAKTEFKVIEAFRDMLWIEAKPKTGRTHQIRVHLSEHGLPILGDPLYFPPGHFHSTLSPRLMLHASQLVFPLPATQELKTVEANLPDDFIQMLNVLKKITE